MTIFVARHLISSADTRSTLHRSDCERLDVPAATIETGLHGVQVRDLSVVAPTATAALGQVYSSIHPVTGVVMPCACVTEMGPTLSLRVVTEQVVEHFGWDDAELDRVERVLEGVCEEEAERLGARQVFVVATDEEGCPLLHAGALDSIRERAIKILTTRH